MDKSEPLGLPKGSVRALITLAIVATACQQTIVGTIPIEAFLPTLGAVITYYFNQRSREQDEDPLPPPALGDED